MATRDDGVAWVLRYWVGFACEQRLVGVGLASDHNGVSWECLASGNPDPIARLKTTGWNALQVRFNKFREPRSDTVDHLREPRQQSIQTGGSSRA